MTMQTEIHAKISDWHSPRNEKCAQNYDADLDCTCKRVRHRKNYRVVRVKDDSVPHGVRQRIILEIHPDGTIILREQGRRKTNSYSTTTGKIFGGLLWRQAMIAAKAKRAQRKSK